MKRLTAIVLLLLSVGNLHAQTNLDSLWNIWQDETQPDTVRLSAMYWYVTSGYMYSKPDSAFYFAQLQYDLAERRGVKHFMALALNLQGITFDVRGNYSEALQYYDKSLSIREEIGDKSGIASSLNNIGLIYFNQGNFLLALDNYQKSLVILEELGKKMRIANTLGNIGLIYSSEGNYIKALEYYQKSLAIKEELDNKPGIAIVLNSIGNIYLTQGNYSKAMEYLQKSQTIFEELGNQRGMAFSLGNIGNIYLDQANYSQALEYYQKSLRIGKELGNQRLIATSLGNIGTIYFEQSNYPKALEYYQKSLVIQKEIGDKAGKATSQVGIGMSYHNLGDYDSALKYCKEGLDLAGEIGLLPEQQEACYCLYKTHKALGNGNKALEYHEQMLVLDDSLQAEETAKQLERMEFQKQILADSMANEEAKVKAQMAYEADVQKKKRSRNLFLGGGLLVLLLAGGLWSRLRFVRRANRTIKKEKDRSENLLLNILPAEIAEELKEKGRADARDFDLVSILFTDFKEFTQTSEKLSAQELVEEINVCFEAFDAICEKYGIEKIKTIGDAYMAAGGLPVPDEAAAKNTVMAAIAMQQFMIDRRERLVKEGKQGFQMRAGIHTGPVVAGIVGVKKFQYDIWGDTVNTASRMESHGEVGKVNISQDTYELIKDDSEFNFESRGKLNVKGKGEVEMYFVHRSSEGA